MTHYDSLWLTQDSPIGVLCVDGCEELSAEEGNLDDVKSFFTTVAAYLSDAMTVFRVNVLEKELFDSVLLLY